LPEAAALIRGKDAAAPFTSAPRPPIATVTLAEIYAAQGHKGRALSVLDEVLEVEPDHEAASSLRERIASTPEVKPVLPPDPEAPEAAPQFAPEEDRIVVTSVDGRSARFRWTLREDSVDHLRAESAGHIVLRILAVTPSWSGPICDSRDLEVGVRNGAFVVHELPEGAVLRAAVGFRSSEVFEPLSIAEDLAEAAGAGGNGHAEGEKGEGTAPTWGPPPESLADSSWAALAESTVAVRPSALSAP
jgi:hypothetical protein